MRNRGPPLVSVPKHFRVNVGLRGWTSKQAKDTRDGEVSLPESIAARILGIIWIVVELRTEEQIDAEFYYGALYSRRCRRCRRCRA
jgi:hypothetical protein